MNATAKQSNEMRSLTDEEIEVVSGGKIEQNRLKKEQVRAAQRQLEELM